MRLQSLLGVTLWPSHVARPNGSEAPFSKFLKLDDVCHFNLYFSYHSMQDISCSLFIYLLFIY
jgi:hypothetical protein